MLHCLSAEGRKNVKKSRGESDGSQGQENMKRNGSDKKKKGIKGDRR